MNTILYPSELLAEQEPIPFLVDRLLPERALAMLWAPSGIGKTFVCLDFCLHIAAGREWQGREVARGGVLYVVGEGFAGMPQRVGAWCTEYGVEPSSLDGWIGFRRVQLDVSDDEVRAAVRDEMNARDLRPSLVVLDTLSANAPVGFDESKTAAMKLLLDGARALRDEHGCTVLLIHHTGWDESRERGSSDLRGAMDVSLSLRSTGEEYRELRIEKARDFAPPDPIRLALRERHGARIVEAVRGAAPNTLSGNALVALRALAEGGQGDPLRASDWERACHSVSTGKPMSTGGFYRAREDLVKQALVVKDARKGYVLSIGGQAVVESMMNAEECTQALTDSLRSTPKSELAAGALLLHSPRCTPWSGGVTGGVEYEHEQEAA